MFYFCGHGIRAGQQDYLLSRSMGEKPHRYLDGVFDRAGLVNTMRMVGPRHQLFMFDTCRNEDSTVLDGHGKCSVFLSIAPGTPTRGPVEQSQLMAAAAGFEAFGRGGDVSLFVEQWLEAAGSAVIREGGEWWLNTAYVQTHMKKFMTDQTPQIEGTGVNLCRQSGPMTIPVVVTCHPSGNIHRVKMECSSGEGPPEIFDGGSALDPVQWRLLLDNGTYSFSAEACTTGDFPSFAEGSISVRPPYADIIVDIDRQVFIT